MSDLLTDPVRIIRVLALGALLPFALLMSLLWVIGRADTVDEVATGKITSWTRLGTVWAVLTFILVYAVVRTRRRGWIIAIGATVAVWVAVGATGSWWEGKKWEIRTERARSRRAVATLTTPASTPEAFTHTKAMPISTTELQIMEERLKKANFETCCFKDGPNVSGHSLVGSYENVDFRIAVMRNISGTINVSVEGRAPSRKQAEGASSKLFALLLQ